MTPPDASADVEGTIFDVDTFAVHDGPGIRLAVYLKGCPLACAWCHSPESQSPRPEVIFLAGRCLLCGTCGRVCQAGVHRVGEGGHAMDRERCVVCGHCVRECPAGALAIKGRQVRAGEIVARAARMRPFFHYSGGGVTLTGGEVTGQPDFAAAVLAGCRTRSIHTAIETCGACEWAELEKLVALADLVLYDLKLLDESEHRRWTGASNARVLAHVRRLADGGANVEVRVPLIPGITDTRDNLGGLFAFLRELNLPRVTLLPFNPSAGAKYEWLGRTCEVPGGRQDEEHLAALCALAEAAGLNARVG